MLVHLLTLLGFHRLRIEEADDAVGSVHKPLESLGYEYDALALRDDPSRHVFRKGSRDLRTHHVHVTRQGSYYWRRLLAFRDYLREHPDVAGEYEQLKVRLAAAHPTDGRAYVRGKGEFVRRVQQRAMA